MSRLCVVILALASFARAVPALSARQAITVLSPAQVTAFKPYSFYAATGYCAPAQTLTWSCGANCNANPGFKPIASGGNGDSVQFWYVGVDPALATVIVSHQGTDFSKIKAILTDADFFLDNLNPTLFPGISSSVKTHSGFADEQAKTAQQILTAVNTGLTQFNLKTVTIVGHSLGGAIGLIDFIYLPLHITGVTFRGIFYGMPRVSSVPCQQTIIILIESRWGNQAFADLASVGSRVTHINNQDDIVPILPGRFLGFHHPTGEIHIQDSGAWDVCPGQDNTNNLCTTGDVSNIFDGESGDHAGPYDGVRMGC